jgi:hypothetical protein
MEELLGLFQESGERALPSKDESRLVQSGGQNPYPVLFQ